MDKPMTFIEWCASKGVIPYSLGIEAAYEAGQQSQQSKVEELKASHHGEVIGHEVHFKKIKQERDELQTLYTQQGINMLKLQKRVDVALKLIESWNEIAFDKTTHWTEGYEEGCYHCAAQLEQALKGEG
ncbi:hypothetical protein AZE74_RS09820 [Acinetobacter baumannii]|nr:hypothetical protein [Acinetobacter baumannii]EHU1546218.1 hypothetical protein [Acinetobacter baumannii]EHU1548316.1 hypothetical protein [Acinetobacter baumannii]EHU1972005.1 hypothetical protein [Acinetobacter baumannii]EHU2194931.1 hypothetical protein [Acinetobacter baumannii]EHU2197509.1 hypothetical protein [Acinetobacter baumannii]